MHVWFIVYIDFYHQKCRFDFDGNGYYLRFSTPTTKVAQVKGSPRHHIFVTLVLSSIELYMAASIHL